MELKLTRETTKPTCAGTMAIDKGDEVWIVIEDPGVGA